MNALVLGGDGLLGGALVRRLRTQGHSVTATSRRASGPGTVHFDLAEPLPPGPPEAADVAFLLAATTSLAACEAEPERTWRVNVGAPLEVARRLAARGTHLVTVSTGLVFSGQAPAARLDEPRVPQGRYAAQKAELEDGLRALAAPTTVLRVTKVAESLGPLLLRWMRDLQAGTPVEPFSDLVCAPLPLETVVSALERVATRRITGVLHLGAAPDLSYLEIATRLAARLGVPAGLVRPTRAAAAGARLAARPRHTTLDCAESLVRLDLQPVDAVASLDRLLAGLLP